MAITVDESFEVAAPPERVWAYLTDPARVVTCLPGAELLEVVDERTFTGRVKIKVGPVTASFRGRATFDEIDAAARRVRMSGKGQETAGAGSATMTMTSEVAAVGSASSRVRVSAQVEVVGRLMQFGRGMMEEVSRQVFSQFAGCVRATLETEAAAAGGAGAAASGAAASSGDAERSESLDALPLVWRSMRKRIGRLFGSRGGDA